MRKEYIIVAPPLSKSTGVKILYLLYTHLSIRGERVSLIDTGLRLPGFNYTDNFTDEIKKNAIVIYPEIVTGNPLNIKNVVRYVLNYPGLLGGNKGYHPSEFIITHAPIFYPGAFKLTIPWLDRNIFYDDNSKKTQNCCFVYKKGRFREVPEAEGSVEINMSYPSTKKELADLLRTTDTLYSFDDCSSLLDEAILCGAKVKIITEDGFVEYPECYESQVADFEEKIEAFIVLTQELNYTGLTESEEANLMENIGIKP